MKKNSFFTFCFAFIPGAGEMYLGMMKKGLAVMSVFWGVCAVVWFFQFEFLYWLLPIIWFYSFFETFNIRQLPYEDRLQMDNAFSLRVDGSVFSGLRPLLEKRHVLIGGGLIFIGGWAIFSSFVSPLIYYFVETMGYESWYLRSILNRIPSVVVAVAVIFFGIYLVKGKKRHVQPEEEFAEYRGDSNE